MPGDVGYLEYGGEPFQRFVKRHAAAYGLGVCQISRRNPIRQESVKIKNCSFVWIWNGWHDNAAQIRELCTRMGIPFAMAEWGLVPQADTYSIDPSGFCGWSSLNGDLSWVTRSDFKRLEDARAELRRQHPERHGDSVLVPLQITSDTQILYNTPYRSMQEFIDHVEGAFPGEKLVFRPHPKDPTVYQTRGSHARVEREGTFFDAVAGCRSVVGLTSTSLLEAVVYGKPVLALGDCALRRTAPRMHDRVAAAALALRVPRVGDPTAILERFGIRPLGCEPVEAGR